MRFAIEFAGAGATADPAVLGELAHLADESGRIGVFLEDYVVHHKRPDMPTCDRAFNPLDSTRVTSYARNCWAAAEAS